MLLVFNRNLVSIFFGYQNTTMGNSDLLKDTDSDALEWAT